MCRGIIPYKAKTSSKENFINFRVFKKKKKKNKVHELEMIKHWTREDALSHLRAVWIPSFNPSFEEIISDMTKALEQNSAVDISLWLINDMILITTSGWENGAGASVGIEMKQERSVFWQ